MDKQAIVAALSTAVGTYLAKGATTERPTLFAQRMAHFLKDSPLYKSLLSLSREERSTSVRQRDADYLVDNFLYSEEEDYFALTVEDRLQLAAYLYVVGNDVWGEVHGYPLLSLFWDEVSGYRIASLEVEQVISEAPFSMECRFKWPARLPDYKSLARNKNILPRGVVAAIARYGNGKKNTLLKKTRKLRPPVDPLDFTS